MRLGKADVKLSPYLYVAPFFLLFALVGLFPLVYTAWVSLHDWHLLGGQGEMVGLQNYIDVVQQPRFMTALRFFSDNAAAAHPGQVSVKGRSTMPSTVSVQPFTSTFGTIRLMSTR